MGQIQGRKLLPRRFQQVPELHGLLGANPPALAASGAQAHVMQQGAFAGLVPVIESPVRTILDAGQATVALLVHFEKRHLASFYAARLRWGAAYRSAAARIRSISILTVST
jgi:hypothetical protein